MNDGLYSIRMHASMKGKHVSGAERIVSVDKVHETSQELLARASSKSFMPDKIIVKIERIDGSDIHELTALTVITKDVPDMVTGREAAFRVLQQAGVSARAAEAAITQISKGPALSGSNMRGAMILDAVSGERLELDHERGVRVSRFDWYCAALENVCKNLEAIGLTHLRTREALALATKVAHAPAMVAELCWSDEPDYTAGYVASLGTGYVRFPYLKERGDPFGGRAFFVDRKKLDLSALMHYLQMVPVLINAQRVSAS